MIELIKNGAGVAAETAVVAAGEGPVRQENLAHENRRLEPRESGFPTGKNMISYYMLKALIEMKVCRRLRIDCPT